MKFLTRSYAAVLVVLLVLADAGGVVHAFRMHSQKDGILALVLPPVGLYRSVESLMHRRPVSDAELVKTAEGRMELRRELRIKEEVWTALLNLIATKKDHMYATTMEEGGGVFDVTVTVPPAGPITLTVQPQTDKNLTISMTDENRDQTPEMLKITKTVDGKPEVHDTPIDKFTSEDSSQFLLAWSLAWGTVAEEQQVKSKSKTMPMEVEVNGEPVGQ